MDGFLGPIVVMAIVGAGVVTGLLFAFSNFVMRALSELPAEQGMFAMQCINEKIINPVFFLFFFGTPFASGLILALSFGDIDSSAYAALVMGSVLYLIGPFGITLLRNVPLNNRLAGRHPDEAASVWPEYQKAWQFWNHIRTYIGIASIACMAVGAAHL